MENFYFQNLTPSVRKKIISEIDYDIGQNNLYLSSRLSSLGRIKYEEILKNACLNGNETLLANNLAIYINEREIVKGKNKKVPKNAAVLLSQGEFNRFYIRAVCLEAIENEIKEVIIYRGRNSSWSRSESEIKIGTKLDPNVLLDDLRKSVGTNPEILPEVNSGLTIKLP